MVLASKVLLQDHLRRLIWNGHFIPNTSVKKTAASLRSTASPLLEEERDSSGQALVADFPNPRGIQAPVMRAAFSTYNYPMDPFQI